MSLSTSDIQIAGAFKKVHALVLEVTPHQENDLILSCLTAEFGKISCFAKSARNSKRRFAPALMQPLNHLLINVRVPRGHVMGRSELWRLESAELKDSFLHLKTSYEKLEWISHFVRLVKDTLPADTTAPSLFRALGRVLRDSESIEKEKSTAVWSWMFLSFWIWFSDHLGWGVNVSDWKMNHENADLLWRGWVQEDEFDALRLAKLLNSVEVKALSQRDWSKFYLEWTQQTAMNWPYFEAWLGLSRRSERETHV